VAFNVIVVFVIGAFFLDLAHRNTGMTPWVAAACGLSYLLAAIFFTIRNCR
jgi:hypothetical protein